MRRRTRVAVAMALLWGAVASAQPVAGATAQALAQAACAGVAPAEGEPPAASFDTLLRADAATALALACRQFGAASAAAEPAVAVAEALTANARLAEAQALLDAARAALAAAASTPATQALLGRVDLALGSNAYEAGKTADAGGHFDRARVALGAAGQTGSARDAAALVGQAAVWNNRRQAGDVDRAEAALDQAAAFYDALGMALSRESTDVVNLRAVLANSRQDLPGAVRWARAEVDIYQRMGLGDEPELLHALTTIGALESQLGHFDAAEAALREGLRIIDLKPDGEPAGQLGVFNNLAALHLDRGEYARARDVAERSVALARRVYGEGAPRTLTPLTVLAQAQRSLALYAPSKRGFEAALAVALRDPESAGPLRLLRLYEAYATVLQALGEPESAQAALDDALRTVRAGDGNLGYWRGRILRRSAALSARAGLWAQADAQAAQAIPLIAAVIGADHHFVTGLRAERCVAQARGKLPGTACAELLPHLDELRQAPAGARFEALAALAIAADTGGRPAEARERHLEALAAALSAGGPDPLWSAHDALAQHLRRGGERALAVLAAKQSVEQIEAMRADLGADARRFERGFLADKLAVYRRLADWLTEDGRIDEALDVLRLLKQEEFNDYVRGGDAGLRDATPAQRLRTARDARLFERWDGLNGVMAAPAPAAERLDEAERLAQRELFARQSAQEQSRVAAWRDFLADNAQGAGKAPHSAPAGRPVPQGRPAPGELRAWVYAGEAHLNLVLQDSRGRAVQRLAADPQALARAVGRLLSDMGRRDEVLPQLQALYPQLGAPLARAAERSGARRLVLHLDGVLRYLPFAALHDGQRYLGERWAVEQRLDAVGDGAPAPAPAGLPTHVRAVGVTRALAGMNALRALAREVCGIVDGPVYGLDRADDAACEPVRRQPPGLPGAAWLNDEFTLARLGDVAAQGPPGQRNLLHVGTHFVLRPGNMGRSWLLLGDGQRLHLDELSRLRFDGQALVTLSACETGLGAGDAAASGQEVDGLNALVMKRGARAVLASLWRVEDDSTSTLMLALYRELGRGTEPALALQRAQAVVRADAGHRHPFFWAGFYLASGGR